MKTPLIAAALSALLLAGCSSGTSSPDAVSSSAPAAHQAIGMDTGVQQCRKLADTSDDAGGVPTDAEMDAVRAAYQASQYSDLKRAGLHHLRTVQDYYDGNGNLGQVLIAKDLLAETCGKHGVRLPEVTAPTFTPQPYETN